MCSFYNPNIQSNFSQVDFNFDFLRGCTFGKFKIHFQVLDIESENNFKFLKFDSRIQYNNLMFIDKDFPETFADIALSSFVSRVNSLVEYEQLQQSKADKNFEGIYFSQRLDHFMERLIFSNIASDKKLCDNNIDFAKINYPKELNGNKGFYTMFERLKLYEFLKLHMKFIIENEETVLTSDILHISIKLVVI